MTNFAHYNKVACDQHKFSKIQFLWSYSSIKLNFATCCHNKREQDTPTLALATPISARARMTKGGHGGNSDIKAYAGWDVHTTSANNRAFDHKNHISKRKANNLLIGQYTAHFSYIIFDLVAPEPLMNTG